MNPNPGILRWHDGTGYREEEYPHVVPRETGGVTAMDFDLDIGHPVETLLELGPSVEWQFEPHPNPDAFFGLDEKD